MSFSVLIADDEAPARSRLRCLLKKEGDFEIVAEAPNGRIALEQVEARKPDVAFLDIAMPTMTGLEVAHHLPEGSNTRVVFVTGFDDFAVEAFAINAIDYLLKPVEPRRFAETLNRIRKTAPPDREELRKAVEGYQQSKGYPSRLLIRLEEGLRSVNVDEIEWVESSGNYVKICTAERVHLPRMTLSGLQDQLDPAKFVRIHRSHIVNLDMVDAVHHVGKGDHLLEIRNGPQLRLSRVFKDDFFASYQKK